MEMQGAKMNKVLKPLCWLIGVWKSVKAKAIYPTKYDCPRKYSETLTIKTLGQPLLNWDAFAWNPKTMCPMYSQNGYLYLDTCGRTVILVTAHDFGLSTVEMGSLNAKQCSMELESYIIGQSPLLTTTKVVNYRRSFAMNNKGQLIYKMRLLTDQEQHMFTHLKVTYEKDCDPLLKERPGIY